MMKKNQNSSEPLKLIINPSGLIIKLPEEAKEECEFIKTVLELEEVK